MLLAAHAQSAVCAFGPLGWKLPLAL
uniref:Uncharacterized protein n=1 Tax=Anguilla anguilla TaxID=7936 RepID=A0A0E9VGJ9_ANGAN